jgi:tryptophan-rich sensory protein
MSSEGLPSPDQTRENTRSGSRTLSQDVGALLLFLIASLAVAGIAGLATVSTVNGWYAEAEKTLWNPPNDMFGPIWGVLYTLMALSAWLVWRQPQSLERSRALGLFAGQLAMNAAWTPLFFVAYEYAGGVALWVALVWIVLLDFAVLATVFVFWPVQRFASVLLVPYWVWLLFATALNASIAVMNT